VVAEPGVLPLLEFALTELWARRVDHTITHGAYTAIGGVEARPADTRNGSNVRLNAKLGQRRRLALVRRNWVMFPLKVVLWLKMIRELRLELYMVFIPYVIVMVKF
jgi:hypothetical protein